MHDRLYSTDRISSVVFGMDDTVSLVHTKNLGYPSFEIPNLWLVSMIGITAKFLSSVVILARALNCSNKTLFCIVIPYFNHRLQHPRPLD